MNEYNTVHGFPPVTEERVGQFTKKHINGVSYSLQHNVTAKSDYGVLTIEIVTEILRQLSMSMDDEVSLSAYLAAAQKGK